MSTGRRPGVPISLEITVKNMPREELLALLDDIRERVASGDSLDGDLRFRHTGCRFDADRYDVTATYRAGSGVRLIGISKVAS